MMLDLGYILLTVTLLFVLYCDTKNRRIHIILPILILCFALFINYVSSDLSLINILHNVGFLSINILGLILYFSLKAKAFVNPIDSSIGLGDIVFFIAITPLFEFKKFILLFIMGLMFSLLLHLIILLFKKVKTIPLAGYISLFLVISIVVQNILNIDISF